MPAPIAAPAEPTPAEPAPAAASGPASGFMQSIFGGASEQEAQTEPETDTNAQAVQVSSMGTIDLHVKDLELSKVLQLLSIQSQRNIVASRNVAGTITADLYNVDFYQAMDAILHTNGFGYQEKGNFIYVYTSEELKAIQDAQRKPITRVYRLNYLTAGDASTFVSPLLSPAGSIAVSGEVSQGFQPSTSDGGAKTYADSDVLLIRDFPENVDEIVAVLGELDVRPKQVLVEATVLQAKLDESNAFGVDLTILADFAFDQFTNPLSVIEDIADGTAQPSGTAITTTPGNAVGGQGTAKIGIITDSVAAFIRALDSVTDTTVLANPKLLVLNRQRANILVGERLGYISTTQSETTTTQSVEFLDVGTELAVRPFVSDDGMIRLELRPSISTGTVSTTAGFVIPDEDTQELVTNIMVQSGQTVVLGGLFKETTTVERKQVPGVGDIPLLGVAFKGQDDTVERNEVIFMVTPSIVKDEPLYAAGEHAKESSDLAIAGARQALLPWSRSKLVASHMKAAVQAHEAGDDDKALWAVNMALNLDPTNVEGQRMREQLTGERIYWPNRSILKSSLDRMVEERLQKQGAQAPAVIELAEQAASMDEASEQALSQHEAVEQHFGASEDGVTVTVTVDDQAVTGEPQATVPTEAQDQAEFE